MGQSASTARDPRTTGYSAHSTPSTELDPSGSDENMNPRQTFERSGGGGHPTGGERQDHESQETTVNHPPEPPEARHARRSSYPLQQMRSIEEEGGSGYELAESEYRSAALARVAARRQSAMSRLGSRILPNSVIRGLLNSQEETPAEGRAHRHGLVSRTPPRSETAHSSSRFSPFSALGARGITRRRTIRMPYARPPRLDSSVLPNSTSDSLVDSTAPQLPESDTAAWRRIARLQRISQMFGHPQSDESSLHEHAFPSPTGASFGDDSSPMDTQPDFGEPLPEPELEPGTSQGGSLPSHPTNTGMPGMRRLPELLRARSARALRRDEQTPLSRVLQLAAAAIAAQLSGSHGPAMPNIQALGNEGLDGSLENFIQSLQQATSSQAQPTPSTEGQNHAGQEGPSPPVNFLRVFRFANADSTRGTTDSLGQNRPNLTGSDNPDNPSDGMSVDEPAGGAAEGRTVTLVVVGVRSVPLGRANHGEQGPALPGGPGLDAFLGLPFLPPNVIPRPQGSTGNVAPRADGSSRMHPPRTAGIPGLVRQPGTNDSRRLSDAGPLPTFPTFPSSVLSESPPGPNPPPSTPAERGRSAVSSGTSTPSRRPSSASAMPPNLMPDLHEGHPMQPTSAPTEDPAPQSAARQRRRSDSEFARHRVFGSGSVRRNGVVEPDQPPPSGGRSWLIYVVGTNLAENHPALTTPSLFTDVRIPLTCLHETIVLI